MGLAKDAGTRDRIRVAVGHVQNHPEKILGNDGKTKYQHISWLVDDLFGTRLSQRDLRHLAVSCDSLPPSNSDRSQFANSLLAFMVHAFIRQGDRSALVQLLSVRCPSRVGFRTTIEASLAGAETLQDPILILGEAYSKSTVPEVRHDLAAAVRRGFTDLGIRGDDDTDFVASAMKWYKAERVCLIPNETYSRNDWEVSVEDYEQDPKLYEHRGPWARQLLFERRLPSSEQLDRADVLKGTWDVVQFAENGVIVPPERINVHRWKIGKTTIAWIGRYGRDEFGIRFAPNEPHAIDLIRRRYDPDWDQVDSTPLIRELLVDVTPAYYELKGGVLKICYPRDGGNKGLLQSTLTKMWT